MLKWIKTLKNFLQEMQNEIKEYEEKLITSQTLAEEYKIQNEKYQQSMDKSTLEMCTKEETVIALEKQIKELEANILNKAEIEQDLETSKEQLLNKEEGIARLTKELSLIKETLDSKEKVGGVDFLFARSVLL